MSARRAERKASPLSEIALLLKLGVSRNGDFKKNLVDEVPFEYALR